MKSQTCKPTRIHLDKSALTFDMRIAEYLYIYAKLTKVDERWLFLSRFHRMPSFNWIRFAINCNVMGHVSWVWFLLLLLVLLLPQSPPCINIDTVWISVKFHTNNKTSTGNTHSVPFVGVPFNFRTQQRIPNKIDTHVSVSRNVDSVRKHFGYFSKCVRIYVVITDAFRTQKYIHARMGNRIRVMCTVKRT